MLTRTLSQKVDTKELATASGESLQSKVSNLSGEETWRTLLFVISPLRLFKFNAKIFTWNNSARLTIKDSQINSLLEIVCLALLLVLLH